MAPTAQGDFLQSLAKRLFVFGHGKLSPLILMPRHSTLKTKPDKCLMVHLPRTISERLSCKLNR
ncbi:MAG TPA: hypothetical protein DIT66_00350 [Rhodobiaceae bacterium]|nr:hypothetical protein [Rhodobiaceae bacterium]